MKSEIIKFNFNSLILIIIIIKRLRNNKNRFLQSNINNYNNEIPHD